MTCDPSAAQAAHAEPLKEAARHLADSPADPPVLIGFDGFIDEILHVVDQRQSVSDYSRLDRLDEFGQRLAAASGLSCNYEFVRQKRKLGGNGPILANALQILDHPTTYIGAIGEPDIHPVFADFAKACDQVVSLCDPALTLAFEFIDGKAMLGRMEALAEIHFDAILKALSPEGLQALLARQAMIGFVNWTMLPHMNSILDGMGDALGSAGHRPVAFIDLADPAKRTPEDLLELTGKLTSLQENADVLFGMNENESHQVAGVLGIHADGLTECTAAIRSALGLSAVVVHPTEEAAVATADGTWRTDGPYAKNPILTTGAGDVFNSGFCHGWLAGLSPQQCLYTGVCASGFYVRNGRPATQSELIDFLSAWSEGDVPG